jgi:hypothetical protein
MENQKAAEIYLSGYFYFILHPLREAFILSPYRASTFVM